MAIQKKRATKKKVAKKRIVRKKVAKKKVVRKKAARKVRANPIVNDHMIVATLRPDYEKAALKKKINVPRVVYFDGAGWVPQRNNAARYHNKKHAIKIAHLIADQDLHGNTRRQLGVIADSKHPKH